MTDVLLILGLLAGGWVFSRIVLKEPILPWKDKKVKSNTVNKKGTKASDVKKMSKAQMEKEALLEQESTPFQEMFPNVIGVQDHMLRYSDNEFTMFAEVEPVNYFLRDPEEQEVIDIAFETWLASINYPVRIYLQNRFVDLTEPIEEITNQIEAAEDLNSAAYEFALNMIEDLEQWQKSQPRYETKRYILFDYKVEVKDLRLDNEDDLEERILEKAFNELTRRVQAARQQLRRGEMEVSLLTNDGITEVIYYAFNRRKAIKNRYRDLERQEKLAIYSTADQSPERIVRTKAEIDKFTQNGKQASRNSDEA